MIARSSFVPCASLLVVLGCGGSTGGSPSARGAPSSESAGTPEGAGGGDSGDAALSQHREEFMAPCMKAFPSAPDYCQCSWDLLLRVLGEKELAGKQPDPAKLAEYKEKLPPTCAGKIPEPLARDKFVEGCGKLANDA